MVEKRFTNKVVVVTGATKGIGLACAERLKKEGAIVCAIQRGHSSLFDSFEFDLSKEQDCSMSIDAIIKKHGRIDVLINNAGFGLFGTFSGTDWQRESDMLHLHILTTTHLTKLLLDGMLKRGSGKILNMSSLAAFQPGPLMSIYYASKAYMLSFSEAIANELKGTGITVTALCPGPTKTSFQEVVSKSASNNKISFNIIF
mgnify:CR=1 FL=1